MLGARVPGTRGAYTAERSAPMATLVGRSRPHGALVEPRRAPFRLGSMPYAAAPAAALASESTAWTMPATAIALSTARVERLVTECGSPPPVHARDKVDTLPGLPRRRRGMRSPRSGCSRSKVPRCSPPKVTANRAQSSLAFATATNSCASALEMCIQRPFHRRRPPLSSR
jgi:hypothetical protein